MIQSTQESEYLPLSWAAREALWIRNLARDIGENIIDPMTAHSDNQAAISLSRSEIMNERTKLVEIELHFVRDLVRKNVMNTAYCPSERMLADMFTKILGAQNHHRTCRQIRLQN